MHQLLCFYNENRRKLTLSALSAPHLIPHAHQVHSSFISLSPAWTEWLGCFIHVRNTPGKCVLRQPVWCVPLRPEDKDWFVFRWPGRGGRIPAGWCSLHPLRDSTSSRSESDQMMHWFLQHTGVETWKSLGREGRREWFACQTIPAMQPTGKNCKTLKSCATRFFH